MCVARETAEEKVIHNICKFYNFTIKIKKVRRVFSVSKLIQVHAEGGDYVAEVRVDKGRRRCQYY